MPPEANPLIPPDVIEGLSRLPFFGRMIEPSIVHVLIALMLLDVLTGYIAAAIHKQIDSTCSYSGMLKKCQMLLIVAAGIVFEFLYPDVPWGRIIAGLLCISEMTSIVENAGAAGVYLPPQLKDTLRRLRAAEKESDNPHAKVTVQVTTPAEIVTSVGSEIEKPK